MPVFYLKGVKGSRGLPGPPGERGPGGVRVSHHSLNHISRQDEKYPDAEGNNTKYFPTNDWRTIHKPSYFTATCQNEDRKQKPFCGFRR